METNDRNVHFETSVHHDGRMAGLRHAVDDDMRRALELAMERMVGSGARWNTTGRFDPTSACADALTTTEHARTVLLRDRAQHDFDRARQDLGDALRERARVGSAPAAPLRWPFILGGAALLGPILGHPLADLLWQQGTHPILAASIGAGAGVLVSFLPTGAVLRGHGTSGAGATATLATLCVGLSSGATLLEVGVGVHGWITASGLGVVTVAALAAMHLAATDLCRRRDDAEGRAREVAPLDAAVSAAERVAADTAALLAATEERVAAHVALIRTRDEEAARVASRAAAAESAVSAGVREGSDALRAHIDGLGLAPPPSRAEVVRQSRAVRSAAS